MTDTVNKNEGNDTKITLDEMLCFATDILTFAEEKVRSTNRAISGRDLEIIVALALKTGNELIN
ncbi:MULTISPECIES: hypothetical protein [Symbiopectobacterium]|uniref:hypothetical protein n=1 Tax=Symbiopectobacterium TaxID=801 RepID=UPI001A2C2877|nr:MULTISPECIES: hypothetical protein [Symbiopectobacterium]MBG6247328.1 hypothetical protein [Candidatus Symbiopectobacterium sp. PLON1]MBT9429499.1 hypothetical protein [Candidatus Symbiopectobacterium endolongispinus]